MLSATAERRLLHYCKRAAISPPDYVFRPNVMPMSGGRHVRYLDKRLSGLVCADEEVRTALLEHDIRSLAAVVGDQWGLCLLDLATAMSLETELRAEAPAA